MRRIIKLFNMNNSNWGRGDKDPDGSRRPPEKKDGPPDLDEVWRDFNNRLSSLFGRLGGRGSNQGGTPRPNAGGPSSGQTGLGVGVVVLVVVLVWLGSGFYIVREGSVGVVTQFGRYLETSRAGMHWHIPAPAQAVELVNVDKLRTFQVGFRGDSNSQVLPEALMLTDDENIVDMQFVVQYRLKSDGAPDYLFNTRDPDDSVRQTAETAMREVVGTEPMDFVLYEGRTQVADAVRTLMQNMLDRYKSGIEISTVAIQNVQPPEQVQAAFDDAVKAGQDRERLINEGEAYANRVLPLAQGQAARMQAEAEGYKAKVIADAQGDVSRFNSIYEIYHAAPAITRERIYLQTMQDIYAQASKVLIDGKQGQNVFYLPLDKIMKQSAGHSDAADAVGETTKSTPNPGGTGGTGSSGGTGGTGGMGNMAAQQQGAARAGDAVMSHQGPANSSNTSSPSGDGRRVLSRSPYSLSE